MKPLFVLFGILAIVCSALADGTIANKEEYVKKINDFRREYAKDHNISNMYELEWDRYLEKKAEAKNFDEVDFLYRANYRDGKDPATVKFIENRRGYYFGQTPEKVKELIEKYKDYHVPGMEELTPQQKKIGCAPSIRESVVDNEKFTYQTLCFLAPEGTGQSWGVPKGKPGSACEKGYKNNDGLCAPIAKSSESSASGNSPKDKSSNSTNPESVTPSNENFHGSSHLIISLTLMVLMISSLF